MICEQYENREFICQGNLIRIVKQCHLFRHKRTITHAVLKNL